MKNLFSTLFLVLSLLAGVNVTAQSVIRDVKGNRYRVEDLHSEAFRSREKASMRGRNDRIRTQNIRLGKEVRALERRLDDCVGNRLDRNVRRSARNYDYLDARDLRNDFVGERRRLEKEYQVLLNERAYLTDHRDWLWNEIDACERRYQRNDRFDPRSRGGNNRREPNSYCECRHCRDEYRRSPHHNKRNRKGKGHKYGHYKY